MILAKIKFIHGCFNKGHARMWFLVLTNSALPEGKPITLWRYVKENIRVSLKLWEDSMVIKLQLSSWSIYCFFPNMNDGMNVGVQLKKTNHMYVYGIHICGNLVFRIWSSYVHVYWRYLKLNDYMIRVSHNNMNDGMNVGVQLKKTNHITTRKWWWKWQQVDIEMSEMTN